MEELFFELLQVAIGTRRELSRVPTTLEWQQFFALSKKQVVAAIAFRGVNRLKASSDPADAFGLSIGIDEKTYLNWLGLTAKVAQKNDELSHACACLCQDLAHSGLYSCILKGQSNMVNYPDDFRDCRMPGDIDVWCWPMDPEGIDIAVADADGNGAHYEKYAGQRGVIEWVRADCRMRGVTAPKVLYHHVDWNYRGIECEVHFRPSWMNNPFHNARLQRWCRDNEQWLTCEYQGYNIPSVRFNAVYQLVHIYRHLFNEGIGLRQLLDYYFVLAALNSETQKVDKKEILQTLSSFGMAPFASAVMWVLQTVFAMPSVYIICEPDEKRGRFLLNEIMLAGNFGKYDLRNVISANERTLRRFIRRQKRFMRFLGQYPSEVIWGPYFTVKQRLWRLSVA